MSSVSPVIDSEGIEEIPPYQLLERWRVGQGRPSSWPRGLRQSRKQSSPSPHLPRPETLVSYLDFLPGLSEHLSVQVS